MLSTSEFRKGARVELDGEPYSIVDVHTHSPSGRGGATLVRVRLRNIRSGQLIDRTFKAGERVKQPDFQMRPAQYLYDEGGALHTFMDEETYEQFPLRREDIESELGFIRPQDVVRALVFNGHCIGIEVPQTVTLRVVEAEPSVRGDTVTAALKSATLETGLEVQVPLFVDAGDYVVIDTRDARYIRRG